MKKYTFGICALAFSFAAASASAETVLTVSSWAGPNHNMNAITLPAIGKMLNECSGGDLVLKIEYGLASPPAQYDTIRDGVADIGWIVHGYTPGKFVTSKLVEVPGIPGSAEQISVAYQKTFEKYLEAAGEAKGVEVLTNFVHGPGLLNTVKPLENGYADINGMKLRIGGGVANMIATALGVSGVNVPAPAVYETIASGVADGVFFPAESLVAFKMSELTKHAYVNPDGMYTTSFGVIMNSDSYNDLTEANRKCIDEISGVELARFIGSQWDKGDAAAMETAKSQDGLQIIEMDAENRAFFAEKTAGVTAAVLEEVDAAGVDGAAALEYLKSQIK